MFLFFGFQGVGCLRSVPLWFWVFVVEGWRFGSWGVWILGFDSTSPSGAELQQPESEDQAPCMPQRLLGCCEGNPGLELIIRGVGGCKGILLLLCRPLYTSAGRCKTSDLGEGCVRIAALPVTSKTYLFKGSLP